MAVIQDLVAPSRRWVRDGPVQKISTKAALLNRWMFLFRYDQPCDRSID